jgi:hypothetical protein
MFREKGSRELISEYQELVKKHAELRIKLAERSLKLDEAITLLKEAHWYVNGDLLKRCVDFIKEYREE